MSATRGEALLATWHRLARLEAAVAGEELRDVSELGLGSLNVSGFGSCDCKEDSDGNTGEVELTDEEAE